MGKGSGVEIIGRPSLDLLSDFNNTDLSKTENGEQEPSFWMEYMDTMYDDVFENYYKTPTPVFEKVRQSMNLSLDPKPAQNKPLVFKGDLEKYFEQRRKRYGYEKSPIYNHKMKTKVSKLPKRTQKQLLFTALKYLMTNPKPTRKQIKQGWGLSQAEQKIWNQQKRKYIKENSKEITSADIVKLTFKYMFATNKPTYKQIKQGWGLSEEKLHFRKQKLKQKY